MKLETYSRKRPEAKPTKGPLYTTFLHSFHKTVYYTTTSFRFYISKASCETSSFNLY